MSDDQEQDIDATPQMEIPQEQAIQQRPVPFMGDELAAAMTAGGNIYITLPGVCRALGLNTQAQFRRIVRTPSLAKHLRSIPLDTRGGVQQVNCLRVDKIALWLAGVETLKVKTEFRAKIEAYQDELAPVAMQVFLRVAGIGTTQLVPATAPPEATALAEQIDTLTGVVNLLREHLAGLLSLPGQVEGLALQLQHAMSLLESLAERQDMTEAQIAAIDTRTQHLTSAHARTVQEMVDRLVRETRHLPTPLTYFMLYGRIKHRFRAGSYKEVPDSRFDELMIFLHDELARATSGQAPEQGSLF
jgi:hypothetical protein